MSKSIPLTNDEIVHIAELLKSDVIARKVLLACPIKGLDFEDASAKTSKSILIKITLSTLDFYDDETEPAIDPLHFSGNPRLN